MIYDSIDNIHRYDGMGEGIRKGLSFIQQAVADLATGHYTLDAPDTYANVQEYTTMETNPNGYEAHQKHIDIQFLLQGEELVKIHPIEGLIVSKPYDADKDCTLYNDDRKDCITTPLHNGYFLILFPNDAHSPQLCINHQCTTVRKVVVKVGLPRSV